MNTQNEKTAEVLKELGFKGKCLRELQSIILDESGLEDLKNFIILNDKRLKSQLQIVHQYKLHLKEKELFDTSSFVEDYENSKTKEDKRKLIEKAVKEHVPMQMLDKIELYIQEDVLKLHQFLDIFDKYGKNYNLGTILNMVESSKNNLTVMFKKATSLSVKAFVVGFSVKVAPSIYDAISLFA